MSPRLVVFDIDGTLIDSQHAIIAAMRQAFREEGHVPPPDATILSIVGLSLHEAVAMLAPSLDDVAVDAVVQRYRAGSRAERSAGAPSPLYPGARSALERLVRWPGLLMGVATGKARPGLDHAFDVHDLHRYFVTAQTADRHPSKPDPAMLRAALAATGCAADSAIMIGDTEFDIAMGRAAGFRTVGVGWGYHPASRLQAAGADEVISSFADLEDVLESLWARPA